MLTRSRERPSGLVKGPQGLVSQEGHVLYGAGMMRWWDSSVARSRGITTWISCEMSCCLPCPDLSPANDLLLVCGTWLLHRWHLVWASGEEPHHYSVPPGWDVHPKGNSQMAWAFSLSGVCKFKWRSFRNAAALSTPESLKATHRLGLNWFEREKKGCRRRRTPGKEQMIRQ